MTYINECFAQLFNKVIFLYLKVCEVFRMSVELSQFSSLGDIISRLKKVIEIEEMYFISIV